MTTGVEWGRSGTSNRFRPPHGPPAHAGARRSARRAPATRCALAIAALAAALATIAGCRAVAPSVRQHGAFAWAAAERSRAASREAWQRWGDAHLAEGDILFVQGESRILLGLVNFSKLASELSDSPFSHVALVAREDGLLVVYDTVAGGPRRTPLAELLASRELWIWGVKRLRPEYRDRIPDAVAYCRQAWLQQLPFDEDFRLDNEELYCAELVENAFRQNGLNLSEPVPIRLLPGYGRLSAPTRQMLLAATSIPAAQAVFIPGNDAIGLWASPCLQPLLDASELDALPGPDAEPGNGAD